MRVLQATAAAAVAATLATGAATTTPAQASTARPSRATARAGAVVHLSVVTANVDFGTKPAVVAKKWRNQISGKPASVIFLQEAKNLQLTKTRRAGFVDPDRWVILHGTRRSELWNLKHNSSAQLGTAILIRKTAIKRGSVHDYQLVKGVGGGWGCHYYSKSKHNIQTRWIASVRVHLTNGRRVRLSSLHMPPQRCQAPYATKSPSPYAVMASNVIRYVKRTTMPTIIGADWNKTVTKNPGGIPRKTGMGAKGFGIDGVMFTKKGASKLTFKSLKNRGRPSKGHTTVMVQLDVPAP